jgi:hypothetical protein
MFFVDGYIPLALVTRRLWDENERMHRTQVPYAASEWDDLPSYEAWISHISRSEGLQTVWDFIENCKFRGVLMPDGTVIQVSNEFFLWWDPTSPDAPNVNLYLGTVGSGPGFEEDQEDTDGSPLESKLRERFGAFLFQPIVFKENEFDRYFERISRWEGSSKAPAPPAKDIVAEIVREFDSGAKVTKKWVKQTLAQSTKAEEFLEIWKKASEQRPKLSKPGPRGPRR